MGDAVETPVEARMGDGSPIGEFASMDDLAHELTMDVDVNLIEDKPDTDLNELMALLQRDKTRSPRGQSGNPCSHQKLGW